MRSFCLIVSLVLWLDVSRTSAFFIARPVIARTGFSPSAEEQVERKAVCSSRSPRTAKDPHKLCTPTSTALFMGRAAAVRAATKSKSDAKKAKVNAVFGKRIIMAVKQGGSPEPNANRALFDVIKQAKLNNVPVDNINRAIKRASESNAGDFKESIYEAYGHGGASLVINVLTDNTNRATNDVKSAVNKRHGKMAESGSVLFMYERKGKIEINAAVDEETLLEAAIEAGCDELEVVPGDEEGTTFVFTDPKEASLMLDAVKSLGYDDESAKLTLCHVSKAPVECSDQEFEKNMDIIDALEELDDVDSVEHNMSN